MSTMTRQNYEAADKMSVLGKPQQCCREIRTRAGTHTQCKRRAVMTHHGRVVLYYCAKHQPAPRRT